MAAITHLQRDVYSRLIDDNFEFEQSNNFQHL
jgi:hypothetical protein